jgi:hypothetical protein
MPYPQHFSKPRFTCEVTDIHAQITTLELTFLIPSPYFNYFLHIQIETPSLWRRYAYSRALLILITPQLLVPTATHPRTRTRYTRTCSYSSVTVDMPTPQLLLPTHTAPQSQNSKPMYSGVSQVNLSSTNSLQPRTLRLLIPRIFHAPRRHGQPPW